MITKRAICRVKNEQNEYIAVHFQTEAKVVLFNDGENLEQKMENLQSIGADVIKDSSTSSDKTWSSSKISEELTNKANHEHAHEVANINGLTDLLSSYLQQEDLEVVLGTLENKSDKNHEHGLHSVNDWRTHLYSKVEINDMFNSLALGFTWKAPVDSLDDLPQNPELGWSVIVGGEALYVYSDEGWINLGVSSLPPVATEQFDGLMSHVDKAKLNSMDADKLAQLDLTEIDTLAGQMAVQKEFVSDLMSRVGINEALINKAYERLDSQQVQLDSIDTEKIEKLGTDLTALKSSVETMTDKVSENESTLSSHEQRLDTLESRPHIYYQTEEPKNVPNGSFWILG